MADSRATPLLVGQDTRLGRPVKTRFIGVHIPAAPRLSPSRQIGRETQSRSATPAKTLAPQADSNTSRIGNASRPRLAATISKSNSSSSRATSRAASAASVTSSLPSQPFALLPSASAITLPTLPSEVLDGRFLHRDATSPWHTSAKGVTASPTPDPMSGRRAHELHRPRDMSPPFMPFRPASTKKSAPVRSNPDARRSPPSSIPPFGKSSWPVLPLSLPFDRSSQGMLQQRRRLERSKSQRAPTLFPSVCGPSGRRDDPMVIDSDGDTSDLEADDRSDRSRRAAAEEASPGRSALGTASEVKSDTGLRTRAADATASETEWSDSPFIPHLPQDQRRRRKRRRNLATVPDSDSDDQDVVIVPRKVRKETGVACGRPTVDLPSTHGAILAAVEGNVQTSAAPTAESISGGTRGPGAPSASSSTAVERDPRPAFSISSTSLDQVSMMTPLNKDLASPPVAPVGTWPDAQGRYERSNCHQCRNTVTLPKMLCNAMLDPKCSKRFCSKCLGKVVYANHPQLNPRTLAFTPGGTFVCPKCLDACPCAACRNKRAKHGTSVGPAATFDANASKPVHQSGEKPRPGKCLAKAGLNYEATFEDTLVSDVGRQPVGPGHLLLSNRGLDDSCHQSRTEQGPSASNALEQEAVDDGTVQAWLCITQGNDGRACVSLEREAHSPSVKSTGLHRSRKAPVIWNKSGCKIRAMRPPTQDAVHRFKQEQRKRALIGIVDLALNSEFDVSGNPDTLSIDHRLLVPFCTQQGLELPQTPRLRGGQPEPQPTTSPPPSEIESDPPTPMLVQGDCPVLSPPAERSFRRKSRIFTPDQERAGETSSRPGIPSLAALSTAEVEAYVMRGQAILAERAACATEAPPTPSLYVSASPSPSSASYGFEESEDHHGHTVLSLGSDEPFVDSANFDPFASCLRAGRDAWLGMEAAVTDEDLGYMAGNGFL